MENFLLYVLDIMKIQAHIKLINYEKDSYTKTININLLDLQKYKDIILLINKYKGNPWNWFDHLPEHWNQDKQAYELDKWGIDYKFRNFFKEKIDTDIIIDFFKKFTPNGADGIENIKIYQVEEINLENIK